ncbi:ribonuclease J [Rhodococcus sp. IEGM 1408]|uniref:ribonuclease J n=1 Tax=Rhodococcus sp. IEGM 1408 TaxID=3082220 RepID=UPI002953FDCB|nr:ribonuclease J [Rhodococcus sp. IEGM 1408]MDV8000409.1 ribonuclease J [Rhodococcus sp. IEGM 1408]
MTENPTNSRGRGRTRRAAGRPTGEPAPAAAAAVQFTEPKAVAKAPAENSGQDQPGQSKTEQGSSQQGRTEQGSSQQGRSQQGKTQDAPKGGSRGRGSSAGSGQGGGNRGGGNQGGGNRGGGNQGGGDQGGSRNRGGRGRGRGRDDTSTAEFGGVKTMQGADMTVRLPSPPKPRKGALRIVALGGISEIGRNMTVFEYDSKLLIVDCGVLFPSSTEPGVDLILPDFGHIEDRLDQVEALVLTHAHEDHIGAIPFLLKLRPNIPIIGSRFTLALVEAKCREHRIKPVFRQVDESSVSDLGKFQVRYFDVNHSIPECLGVVIKAGDNTVMMSGDIKLDQLPTDKRPTDLPKMSRFGDEGIDLLLLDSTNATTPGISRSEAEVGPTLARLISDARQLVVVACFASNVYRVQSVLEAAAANGRKVALTGRSMIRNMEIALEMGLLTDPKKVLVDMDTAAKLPAGKVLVMTTGTQGEAMAGLSRMARREHRQINLSEGDTVLFSSSIVPGNEEPVFGVQNSLSQMGVKVVTGRDATIHVSGHGDAGELLFVYNAVRPKNAMPVHGEWRHLRANKALAIATGVPEKNVVLAQNGVVVELIDGKASVVGQVQVGNLYVDGLSTGDIGDTVLADRTALSEDGFIVATVVVDPRTGRPVSKPQIIGKGFTDEPGALDPVVELVENALWDLAGEGETDPYRLAQAVRRTVGSWVSEKWRRKPMIVPTVITSVASEA